MTLFPRGTFFEGILTDANGNKTPVSMDNQVQIEGCKYYNSITAIGTTQQVQTDSRTNEITFLNDGTSTVIINNVLNLYPGTPGSVLGDAVSFDGKEGETDVTLYQITFSPGGINNCIVLRKNYQ